jgi:hypothetical protein
MDYKGGKCYKVDITKPPLKTNAPSNSKEKDAEKEREKERIEMNDLVSNSSTKSAFIVIIKLIFKLSNHILITFPFIF